MGRMKKKAAVPLSLFYLKYFAYIFVSMLFLAILLLVAFNALMNSDIVYPANYAQEQAAEAYDTLQQANEITPDLIPDLCDYTIFDLNGNAEGGNTARKAECKTHGRQYKIIKCRTEGIILP